MDKLSLITIALFSICCTQTNLPAPEGSILYIEAEPKQISFIGGVSLIKIKGFEKNGKSIRDGVLINFSTTLGTIDSSSITKNGKAYASLKSNGISGIATVSATSGNSAPVSTDVTFTDFSSSIQQINVSSFPESVSSSGGKVNIIINVLDFNNNPISSVPIILTTTKGTFLSNGKAQYTDENGKIEDKLFIPENIYSYPLTITVKAYYATTFNSLYNSINIIQQGK
ncbi:MAG: hypothetical protein AB1410_10525 [Acidobacteriota bacterium]